MNLLAVVLALSVNFVEEHPWRVFYDTEKTLTTNDVAAVKGYPDELKLASGRTVKAVEIEKSANRMDLQAALGIVDPWKYKWDMDANDNHQAILVNELYAPAAGTAEIGVAAEWWLRLYVNGKEVYTTYPDGDMCRTIEYTNHIVPVDLKKGKNLVVLYTRRGLGHWYAAFGAPPVVPQTRTKKELARQFFNAEGRQLEMAPWVMDPASDSATVCVSLAEPHRAGVEYRERGTEEWKTVWQYTTFQKKSSDYFRFELKDLKPDTRYDYRVVTIEHSAARRSEIYGFRTWSAKSQPVKLAALADLHFAALADSWRVAAAKKIPGFADADVFVSIGDSVTATDDFRGTYMDWFMKGWLKELGNGRYFLPLYGNHEFRGDESSEFERFFGRGYRSARLGDVWIVALNSGEYGDMNRGSDAAAHPNTRIAEYMAEQRRWLENEVKGEACRTAKYRVVFIHSPPADWVKFESANLKPLLDGLLVSFDKEKNPEVLTHVWLCGHKHTYWLKTAQGVNQMELTGPYQGVGAATVETRDGYLSVKGWTADPQKLLYDLQITPDGAMTDVLPNHLLPKPRELAVEGDEFRETDPSKRVYAVDPKLPKEGYELKIAADGIRITSADAAGRFWAEQTLKQLNRGDGRYVRCTIRDWPEFSYRGVLVDDGRCNYGVGGVKRIIDQMSEVKLNVFHWHFIESGCWGPKDAKENGWRIEVPGYPKLTEKQTKKYARKDLEAVVAYAKERHVRVVPEVEMPGHNDVASFYPEFGHGGKGGGICVANEKAVKFFKDVIDYVTGIFPDELVHFGGDEVSYAHWKTCPDCQAKMKALGLKTEAELQAWFMGEMAAYLKAKGKTPLGWSDMLLQLTDNMHKNEKGYWTGYSIQTNLPKDVAITAWYGDWEVEGGCGAVAANLGYKTLQYPANHTYFDYAQGVRGDKHQYNTSGKAMLRDAYMWNPYSDVKPECRKNVLGVGCANWGEKATDQEALEWKLWPRGFAIAEIGWTCPKLTLGVKHSLEFNEFNARAQRLGEQFRARGISAAHDVWPTKK